jgi:tetratricopeptide (TPR) repeat protein
MIEEKQTLEALAHTYRQQVEALAGSQAELPAEHVLACLVTRDRIAYLTGKDGPAAAAAACDIAWGDRQLKSVLQTVRRLPELAAWRVSFNPPAGAWWWPEPSSPPPPLSERFNWLWTALALILLAVSLSLIADISTRFLSGDTDAYGILAVVGPTVLTLFTTRSVLTQAGQEAARRILGGFKIIPSHLREELGFIMAALLLVGLVLFWYALPYIAERYNDSGLENYLAGQYASAQADFERAIKLNPDLLEARYNLGVLFEDLNEPDQAREQYQLAVHGGKLDAAYNNLARLYILEGAYNQAVPLLVTLEKKKLAGDGEVSYDVKKNLGWARLGQERYEEALVPLEEAIQLQPERAPAYCLQAQVLQGLPGERQTAVEQAWLDCIRYADETDPDEDRWLGLARQYFLDQAAPEKPAEEQTNGE